MRLRIPRLKVWHWLLLAAGGAAGLVLAVWILRHISIAEMIDGIRDLGPLPLFGALAVLPAVGAPVTPFYLAAGAAFGRGLAIPGCVLAIALNIALSYACARWLVHPVAARLVERLGYRIPVVRPEDRWQIALLLRITPGPPFFVQSYLLGLSGVPFGIYMIVSVAIAAPFAVGLIVFGDSLTKGSVGQIVLGVSLVLVAVIAVRLVRKTLQRRARESAMQFEAAPAGESGQGKE